jgi:hypothetical protein
MEDAQVNRQQQQDERAERCVERPVVSERNSGTARQFFRPSKHP